MTRPGVDQPGRRGRRARAGPVPRTAGGRADSASARSSRASKACRHEPQELRLAGRRIARRGEGSRSSDPSGIATRASRRVGPSSRSQCSTYGAGRHREEQLRRTVNRSSGSWRWSSSRSVGSAHQAGSRRRTCADVALVQVEEHDGVDGHGDVARLAAGPPAEVEREDRTRGDDREHPAVLRFAAGGHAMARTLAITRPIARSRSTIPTAVSIGRSGRGAFPAIQASTPVSALTSRSATSEIDAGGRSRG